MSEMLKSAWLGMLLICPNCKQGRMGRNLTSLHEKCPNCGVIFEREEGDFLGAMVMAYSVLSVIVAAGVYVLEVFTDLTAMQHILLWSVFSIVFLILTYRNWKGLWVGMLHQMVGLRRR